jgi:hypothetical protein
MRVHLTRDAGLSKVAARQGQSWLSLKLPSATSIWLPERSGMVRDANSLVSMLLPFVLEL